MSYYQVLRIVSWIFQIYDYLIIAFVLMSWLPNVRESFVGQLLGRLVEPYLRIFRKIIPPIGGVLDVSPIVALIALFFIQIGVKEIINVIYRLALG